MRKSLLLILLVCASYMAFSSAIVTQKEWRWRADDGNETNASWAAAPNGTAFRIICDTAKVIRLRIAFQTDYNTTQDAQNPDRWDVNFRLAYSTSANGNYL